MPPSPPEQNVFNNPLSEDDDRCIEQLRSWLVNTVELGPNFANAHATAIYHKEGVYTPERLAKKLMKNAKLLESLGMPEDQGRIGY